MKSFQTAFSGKPEQKLATHDKYLLSNRKDEILVDLSNLKLALCDSQTNITKSDKMKLTKVIYLSRILGFKQAEPFENIVKELNQKKLFYVPKILRQKIQDDISSEFNLKLKISDFDKLMNSENIGIKKDVLESFLLNGVWKSQPDIQNQRIRIWGALSEEKFLNAVNVNSSVIDYIQQPKPEDANRDDSKCFHSGCAVKTGSISISYRDFLKKSVSKMLQKIREENNLNDDGFGRGTAGIFLKRRGGKCYLVTAAHVLFPELSKIDMASPGVKDWRYLTIPTLKRETFSDY